MNFIIHWFIATLAIIISAYLLPGTQIDNFFAAVVTALVLGLINAFIRPFLILLTFPINILTLGFFTLVINASLIMLTQAIVPGFHVGGFLQAFLFSVVLSIINFSLSWIEKEEL